MRRKFSFRLLVGLTAAVAALVGVTVALASSGSFDGGTTNSLVWDGQGSTGGAPNTSQCSGDTSNPGDMLFILTTDGATGQVVNSVTGVASGTLGSVSQSGNQFHIVINGVTDLNALNGSLKVTFTYGSDGGQSHETNLTLSHGCGGGRTAAAGPTVSKDANGSYTETYGWKITKSVDQSKVFTKGGASATVSYSVSVSHGDGQVSDVKVTGTIDVNNPDTGNETLNSITDEIVDGSAAHVAGCTVDTSAGLVVAPGDTNYPYSCDLGNSLPSGDVFNYVKIAWSGQDVGTTQHLAAGSSDFTTPVAISFAATEVDNCVSVTDTNPAGPQAENVCVGDANPTTFNYDGTVSGDAGTCTDNTNTASFLTNSTGATDSASATVVDCQGADLTVKKDATPAFTRAYSWSIDKSANPTTVHTAGGDPGTSNYTVNVYHDGGTDSAWRVTGTITVSNPNDWESVTLTGVSDEIDNSGDCSITSGDVNGTIDPSGSATFGYTCSYSSAPDPAAFTNTATATWDAASASTPDGSADGTATGAFGDPTTIIDGSVSVTDSLAGSLGTVSYQDPSPTTFQYDGAVHGDAGTCTTNNNTATFTTDTTGSTGSGSATVTDCQGADLTVTKTATGSFNRDYDWSVVKQQTTSSTPINSSASSVTVAYKVKASWTGPADSGWKVTGTITVTNPNDWESVTLTGVSDAINNGGVCSITSGDVNGTIAAGGSATFGYKCTYASAPSPAAGTNTATATWDKTAASTPNGSGNGTAGVNFGTVTPTVTHNTTTVTDAFNGGAALTLGVANINGTFVKAAGNNLASWTSSYLPNTFTFTYTRSVPVVASMCKKYDNTATVSGDATNGDNSSSASVTVCGLVTGGLTIGYWGNNNGKAQECANDPKWRNLLDGTFGTAPYTGGSYLRNANGTYYAVPATPATCATATSSFDAWLQGANSSNASYMLSAQLAGAILNVNLNGMNGNACIAGTSGPITINNLIANVITFLRANGNTTAAGTARNTAVAYETILDSLNNGHVYAVTGC